MYFGNSIVKGWAGKVFIYMGHRVGVWVILYLFEHTGEDFQSEIFLVA